VQIPLEFAPHPAQVPAWVNTSEQHRRFDVCFAIGRAVCGRDDPIFVRELFDGPIPLEVAGTTVPRSLLDE
jgi:hypothetical protein